MILIVGALLASVHWHSPPTPTAKLEQKRFITWCSLIVTMSLFTWLSPNNVTPSIYYWFLQHAIIVLHLNINSQSNLWCNKATLINNITLFRYESLLEFTIITIFPRLHLLHTVIDQPLIIFFYFGDMDYPVPCWHWGQKLVEFLP